eukprot:Amastigsp_a356567_3.p3 type:complete len:100 gc:universal Amastigsp_a356567_3:662-363(-)
MLHLCSLRICARGLNKQLRERLLAALARDVKRRRAAAVWFLRIELQLEEIPQQLRVALGDRNVEQRRAKGIRCAGVHTELLDEEADDAHVPALARDLER